MSGLIPQRFVEDLLDRLDLAELIGSRITLKKAGANYKACCPFHDEKTPSFNVRPDKGFYHCFGCGAHGDAISFIREFEGIGFTEAVEELAKRAGLEVPYDKAAKQEIQQARTLTDALDFASRFYQSALTSQQGAYARDYLQQRGLDDAIVQQYQIGYAPSAGTALFDAASKDLKGPLVETGTVSDKYRRPRDLFRNRVMFPIRNSRGKTIAFGGRTLGDDKAKYINSPESDVFHKPGNIRPVRSQTGGKATGQTAGCRRVYGCHCPGPARHSLRRRNAGHGNQPGQPDCPAPASAAHRVLLRRRPGRVQGS